MKRKTLLIVILLCLLTPWAARAQLVLFSEDFNSPVAGSQFLPTGWYNEGSGNSWRATQYNPSPSEGSYCVFANPERPRGVKLVRTLPAFPSWITSARLRFKHIHPVRNNYYVDVLNVYYRTPSSNTRFLKMPTVHSPHKTSYSTAVFPSQSLPALTTGISPTPILNKTEYLLPLQTVMLADVRTTISLKSARDMNSPFRLMENTTESMSTSPLLHPPQALQPKTNRGLWLKM